MIPSRKCSSFCFIQMKHTCSENSATSMKSLWNCAAEVQGLDGGMRGTESSSGRPCTSWPSSSPNPSVPVKASRSGDPIIFRPWGGFSPQLQPWRFDLNIKMSRSRPACSQLFRQAATITTTTTGELKKKKKTCCAVNYSRETTDTEEAQKQKWKKDPVPTVT